MTMSPGRFRRRPLLWCDLLLALFALHHQSTRVVSAYDDNYNDYNSNSQYCPTPRSLCEDSVIKVTNIEWYCNSPYSYYWGSGAHRNSNICAYNDKVTFQVSFTVTDDIYEVNDVYVSLAIQDSGTQQMLKTKGPSYLCNNFVGSDCTAAGQYQFTFTVSLGNSGDSSSGSSEFCPALVMAFSTESDSGYNLGALNMQCAAWQNNHFVTWAKSQEVTPRDWIRNYGMILGTGICLIIFSGFVWQQARRVRVSPFGSCVDPCTMELDQYYKYPEVSESASHPVPTSISTHTTTNLNTSHHGASRMPNSS